MKFASIPSGWVPDEGFRLDARPYTSGVVQTRKVVQEGAHQPLRSVTAGYNGGIYTPPIHNFSRNYVQSAEHGVPFLGSTTMLRADLEHLPLLAKKDAYSPKLRPLRLEPGMTLISASGTIGRVAYVRPDMDGIWSSGDVMKVCPNRSLIRPGYLHAFLASGHGVSLVSAGTYGSIIQHIEASHLAELPVPRLADGEEARIAELVDEAAQCRTKAARLKAEARAALEDHLQLSRPDDAIADTPIAFDVGLSALDRGTPVGLRLDARFFKPRAQRAADELVAVASRRGHKRVRLSMVARVFTPGIFKRLHVDDPSYGYAYYSGSELFQYSPEPRGFLSRRAPGIEEYLVQKDWLLIQDAGQIGGLIGKVTRVSPTIDGAVVSNHLMRVVAETPLDAAFLFALLTSDHGQRVIVRHAFGSSIPQLDPKQIGSIEVPWPQEAARVEVAEGVLEAWQLEDRATEAERDAIQQMEDALRRRV
jgi:type I restriction enzyme S subunit